MPNLYSEEEYLLQKSPFRFLCLTQQFLCIRVTSRFNITINEQNSDTKREILSFADQNEGFDYSVGSPLESTYGLADTGDDSLQNFFSRPIKIQSYNWGTGTILFESFNPWQDFWENPRVLNRITNFNLLRCKLCVKIILNGNGFHYGRAIASYTPLHTADGFTKDRAFFLEDIVEASQRPHVYLDPTQSQGGTLCLPFVWQYNAMDVPDQDWREMGEMIIHTLQTLKHANGATDSVTVSVFAWAEDVVMSTPTANEPGALSPQSGEYDPQADEYGTGVISKPAASIARAAGALATAPIIGAYAKATQIGANAIAAVANVFGYSRPIYVGDIEPYKPTFLGNMANTNATDTSNKLTLDMKQELTCDSRTMGLDGTDEMSIKSIATRESFLTSIAWNVSDTTEFHLWSAEVNPQIWNDLLVASVREYHMPACCFAALPFKYWRGSMKYRFQIVASAFHKGRLKIVYDPSFPLTNEYNTNYTRVIDLAEERDFTVEIGWGQQQAYLRKREMLGSTSPPWSYSTLTADAGDLANGIISMYVVNELTVPNSTANNDISINVFVSCGDDIEFAAPDENHIRDLSWFTPQSGEYGEIYDTQSGEAEVADGHNTILESAPMKPEIDESMAATNLTEADHTNDIYFGDPIVSIRQLLKRYCFSQMIARNAINTTGMYLNDASRNDFPRYRGYVSDGEHQVTTPVNPTTYQFSNNTFLNYFTPAFTCRRGGLRWKYHLISNRPEGKSNLTVIRNSSPEFSTGVGSVSLENDANNISKRAAQMRENFPSMVDGGYVTSADGNPVVEVELPYYRPQRFAFAKQSNLDFNRGTDSYYHDLLWMEQHSTEGSNNFIMAYSSVGEDYTLAFFTGAPVAYQQVDPTPIP